VSVAAGTLRAAAAATAREPNVVLMICDDFGSADLGCYGSHLRTPNLDRMAANGARLTNFNAAHPICSASRAALMTGRYAARSGTFGAYFPYDTGGMSLEETTLANLFHQKNYQTMCVGKWHLGHTPEYLPTHRGFDAFYGVPYSVDMYPLPLLQNEQVLEKDANRELLTPRYTEQATRFIAEASQSARPFFLYLAFSYPHNPALASSAFKRHSRLGIFGDCVEEIDASVGSVMDALKQAGVLENTIVLFTNDHGPWFQGSPGKLRGRKGSTFEGGFRVPLLVQAAAHVSAGTVIDGRASNFDLLPTLASWCGLDMPVLPLDGLDISALLAGTQAETERGPILYFSPFGNRNDLHSARIGDWKLRVAQVDGEMYIADRTSGHESYKLGQPELYQLREDPTESYDVADRNQEMLERIRSETEAALRTFPAQVLEQYQRVQSKLTYTRAPVAAAPPLPCATC
jgi:arylsulfatase